MTVVHHPRVAWEGARVFVAAADTDTYWWLGDMVGRYLGVMYQLKLAETRLRLQSEDAAIAEIRLRPQVQDIPHAETGAWRARLTDLLHDRPDLTGILVQLIEETTERLPR